MIQTYVVVVEGLLSADALGAAVPSGVVRRNGDHTSVAVGVRDQPELYRVLRTIGDLGFTLLSVERAESTG